jgi:hypothetical protein
MAQQIVFLVLSRLNGRLIAGNQRVHLELELIVQGDNKCLYSFLQSSLDKAALDQT